MVNKIPIVFAFDERLILPAEVCISSLLMHAAENTFYDIFILHAETTDLSAFDVRALRSAYPHCAITFRCVGDSFSKAFEIRGITVAAYYRLLIPELIPEYDKVIYSDVDVIFRTDLENLYFGTDLQNNYLGGVVSLAQHQPDYRRYYVDKMDLNPARIVYSGNLLINSKQIREDGLLDIFKALALNKYRFQDMDILNKACEGRIIYLPPLFCVTTYFMEYACRHPEYLLEEWTKMEIENAKQKGCVHYNGKKPWQGCCVNFDIWWEYYRKSPFFDEKFYFDFFYGKLNELDQLPLWKRVKILLRYFVYGRRAN